MAGTFQPNRSPAPLLQVRIRCLRPGDGQTPDKKLYAPDHPKNHPALTSLIGEKINTKLILVQWPEILRLVTSIKQGTVTASLILRKLASYPRQNSLALALRELGRIERTLFTLNWLLDPALRQKVTAGLNKGEAKNTAHVGTGVQSIDGIVSAAPMVEDQGA